MAEAVVSASASLRQMEQQLSSSSSKGICTSSGAAAGASKGTCTSRGAAAGANNEVIILGGADGHARSSLDRPRTTLREMHLSKESRSPPQLLELCTDGIYSIYCDTDDPLRDPPTNTRPHLVSYSTDAR